MKRLVRDKKRKISELLSQLNKALKVRDYAREQVKQLTSPVEEQKSHGDETTCLSFAHHLGCQSLFNVFVSC